MRKLPKLVAALTHNHDAWIVGSAADPRNREPRDYDVQVPLSKWGAAAHLIPSDAKVNGFGGFKCLSEGVEVDVWPGELGWVLQRPQLMWVWHPASGTRFRRETVESYPLPPRVLAAMNTAAAARKAERPLPMQRLCQWLFNRKKV